MTELLNISGRSMDARSLPKFTWNADLIYFDGPMLSLFKQDDGQDVLFAWLDCDERKNRWCIVPIQRESLRMYLSQEITLRSVFLEAPNTLVFHTGKDAKRRNFLLLNSLPEDYLPASDSYLVDQISTSAAKRLATETTQDVELGLNGELYLEDMEGIPKLYQQLYSFHYGMEHLDRPAVRDSVQHLMTRWRGGIGAVNLFSGLKNVTPSIHRARLLRLHYASPGQIKLNLLPTLAAKIRIAMSHILIWETFDESEELYRDIYRYFKDHQIGGFDDERAVIEMELPQHQVDDLMFFVNKFFRIIGWGSYRDNFVTLEMTAISQLRMLLAYYRRLRKLRDYVVSGKLSLEGQFSTD
jgi:hypothetical protein